MIGNMFFFIDKLTKNKPRLSIPFVVERRALLLQNCATDKTRKNGMKEKKG
jgi:hypothetical protein